MHIQQHPLIPATPGQSSTLTSLHYGPDDAATTVYIQASLHADELPGMLVAHHLRGLLDAAEAAGRLRGRVVLVPMANPLGLAQTLLHSQLGRFDLASGENFNRRYPQFAPDLAQDEALLAALGADAAANRTAVRAAVARWLDAHPPVTQLQSLRHTLMRLSHAADVVLDLHCDFQAAMHLYTEPACTDTLLPLAALLGARAVLVAEGSGGLCFDEVLSGLWWQLARELSGRYGADWLAQRPIPQGCASTTVELRGQCDVSHALAQPDAAAIFRYLVHLGVVQAVGDEAPLPELPCTPTPLTGSEDLSAPHGGVVAYLKEPGDEIFPGDVVAEVIDPVSGRTSPVVSQNRGVLYARHGLRWATTGMDLGKVSGAIPRRSGYLLTA
ncbi:succinylglutamate desuccinylase/aspartoacylase family protein [Amphibiibacter pelophylacis]|uniref:M14 family metallopeptidase n=1 Tax=Amphibiibacter pelophylacis TaxID=1799477 RepID=A0ACC6P0A2_9BURK